MISIKQAVKVLRAYLQKEFKDVPSGILTGTESIPLYKCEKYGLPPICINSQEHSEIRSICANFYKSLKSSEQEAVCPFGINILYLKTDNVPTPIDYFLQTGFTPNNVDEKTVKDLNRVPKKAIRSAMTTVPMYKFPSNIQSNPFDSLKRISETLLAGRVAASMRMLTHEILTPVKE
jgi:hypothetical protein